MSQQKNVRKDKCQGSIISGRGSPLHGHSPQFTLQNDIRQEYPFLSAKRQDDLLRESGHSGMNKEEPRNVCHVL